MKNTKSFLKPLSKSIYKTNESQENGRNVGYCVVKFCNIRRVCIIFSQHSIVDVTGPQKLDIVSAILLYSQMICLSRYLYLKLQISIILEEIEEETSRSHPGLGSLLRLFLFVC